MSLSARVLNAEASVNSYVYVDSVDFMPGAEIPIVLRLWNTDLTERGDRYVPPSTAVITLQLLRANGDLLTLEAEMNEDDRSIITATASPVQSADVIGGNVVIQLDLDGTGAHLRTAVAYNALRRLSLDAEPLPFNP